MQPTSRNVGVGVDLGSSSITVSTRRSGDLPETRHLAHTETARADGDTIALTEAVRTAGDPEKPAAVALTVPATWSAAQRLAHVEAAANTGFDGAVPVPEPEAAARYFVEVQGRELDPGRPLVVYNLGAGSCQVGVVRREGDGYRVESAAGTDDVGGREFDRRLVDHLAGRHRTVDPEFWQRVTDPSETALRASLLEAVRSAREHLTDRLSVTIALPESGRRLRLTREEAEQCLAPAVLQTVALIEEAMREAGIGAEWIAGLLLVGGASRTPLVASIIGFHLGVEPILPEMPELALAEGAALAALAQGEAAGSTSRIPAWLQPRVGVLAAILVLFIAITAAGGVALHNGDRPDADLGSGSGSGGDDAAFPPHSDGTGDTSPDDADTGAPGAEETSTPLTPEAQDEHGGERSASTEPTSAAPATPATNTASPVDATPAERQSADSTAEIPDVVGESVADAKRILAEAGFTNVVVQGERRTDPGREHCEATAQNPGSGSRHDYGDRITVSYIYVGSDDC
jgi:hypothetical protein